MHQFLKKREIAALPIKVHPSASTSLSSTSPSLTEARQQTQKAMLTIDDELKSQYYGATLGFYKSFLKDAFRSSAGEMVRVFNEFAVAREGLAYNGASGEVPGSELILNGLATIQLADWL